MSERSFMIQRYCSGNWPHLRGELPFFVTGPKFYSWAIRGSLDKHGEHRFVSSLRSDVEQTVASSPSDIARESVAELLLREEIVQAVWVDWGAVRTDEWARAVADLALHIPGDRPIGAAVIELLAGISPPEFYRSYVSEDGLKLSPTPPPQDGM